MRLSNSGADIEIAETLLFSTHRVFVTSRVPQLPPDSSAKMIVVQNILLIPANALLTSQNNSQLPLVIYYYLGQYRQQPKIMPHSRHA